MAKTGRPFRSTTETSEAPAPRKSAAAAPHLVLVGLAGKGGRPPRDRLQPIGEGLEVGRGRSTSRAGTLTIDDPWVSAAHARVTVTGKRLEVVDLGSRNGTFVDGVLVKGQALREASVLLFGGCAAVVRSLSSDDVSAIADDLREPFGPVPTASA